MGHIQISLRKQNRTRSIGREKEVMKYDHLPMGGIESPRTTNEIIFTGAHDVYAAAELTGAEEEVDLRDAHEFVVQQEQNCCTHTMLGMHQDFARVLGKPIPRRAAAFSYPLAVGLDTPPDARGLYPDAGSNWRNNLQSWRDYGCPAEIDYPEVPENFRKVPPLDVRQKAKKCLLVGSFARVESGEPETVSRLIRVMRLARRGVMTTFSMLFPVFENFPGIGQATYTKTAGRLLGWHAHQAIAHSPSRRAFGFATTWPWGEERGVFWMSEDAVRELGIEFFVGFEIPVVLL